MKNFLNLSEEQRLNEIVFENRNKEYGAYVLRSEEGQNLKKALFIGIAFIVTMGAIPIVLNAFKAKAEIPTIVDQPLVWVEPIDVEKDPEIPQPQPSVQKPVETFTAVVPTPTKNPPVETPAPSITKYDDAKPGFTDTKGEKPTTDYVPPITKPTVIAPTTPVVPEVVDPNAIITKADVNADFIGGINSFRTKVSQNMDISDFEGSGEKLSAKVTFIVERDGTISNIKSSGADSQFNKEAEKAVKAVKGKWNAAKLKGQAVRTYFSIPITIQFE